MKIYQEKLILKKIFKLQYEIEQYPNLQSY